MAKLFIPNTFDNHDEDDSNVDGEDNNAVGEANRNTGSADAAILTTLLTIYEGNDKICRGTYISWEKKDVLRYRCARACNERACVMY